MDSETLLIPVEFPDPEPLPTSFIGGFTTCKVILLGLYETPDDLAAEERQRREIEANSTLYSLANQFVRSGDLAEVELLMDTDLGDATTRIAEERDVDAVLIPNPITTLGRMLIPIRNQEFAQPIAEFVGTLNEEQIIHTTLLHVAEEEDAVQEGQELLAEVRDHLIEAGYPGTAVDSEVVVSDDPAFTISQHASDCDLIVMGETEDPLVERVFGKTYEIVADDTELPVVVVRKSDD